MCHNNFVINMKDAVSVASTGVATFSFPIEKSIAQATAMTMNTDAAGAVPAWYDKTNKRVYAANVSGHYWAVDNNKLTYT